MDDVTRDGIRVTRADEDELSRWDGYVARSPQGSIFHGRAFLEALERHTPARFHPLVGYKGQEPLGVFPVFEHTVGIVTMAFSPPPGVGMSQLGPALLGLDAMKRRTAETRLRQFVEGCLAWIDESIDPSYTHVRTHVRYPDHRPFAWNGFDMTPRCTYIVELDRDEDEIMAEFSRDARRNIRNSDGDYHIAEGGIDAIGHIIDHLDRRHREQDLDFPIPAPFIRDLHRSLPDGAVRAYECTVNGQYATGMIALEGETTIYRWQGGAMPLRSVDAPVNDLLDWRIMEDGIGRGLERYDLVGANTPGLCEYKSKFGPRLESYLSLERGTRLMRTVSKLYNRL